MGRRREFRLLTTEGTRRATQTRYFITSLPMDAGRFLEVARSHWGVENGLHWRLDVDFREDDTRKKRNAAKNFSLICKMGMAILPLTRQSCQCRGRNRIRL
ncbi:ISAs1 family transposase [Prevotella nigrescens]|nr:ISAs1 family transposase [Prevotella nigrescens]